MPAFGALYRVESDAPLDLVRLKADEVPKGAAIAKDSVAIPLMRDDAGSAQVMFRAAKDDWRHKTIFVAAIDAAKEDQGGPVAHVKLEDIRKDSQKLRRGDKLQFGESEWVVRTVVPPDAERKTLGWVELGAAKKQ